MHIIYDMTSRLTYEILIAISQYLRSIWQEAGGGGAKCLGSRARNTLAI